jgi:cyclohexyl-isocyanide hydratase
VVADIAGDEVAKSIQLSLEYDPHPPFDSGYPDRASAHTLAEVGPRYAERRADFREGIERLATV